VQNRLNGEALEEYITPVGGGFFFAFPGVADEHDWYGRALLKSSGS
jgi:deferrochelatase/peroxidase EfeB